jgi:hypothetical protein
VGSAFLVCNGGAGLSTAAPACCMHVDDRLCLFWSALPILEYSGGRCSKLLILCTRCSPKLRGLTLARLVGGRLFSRFPKHDGCATDGASVGGPTRRYSLLSGDDSSACLALFGPSR